MLGKEDGLRKCVFLTPARLLCLATVFMGTKENTDAQMARVCILVI